MIKRRVTAWALCLLLLLSACGQEQQAPEETPEATHAWFTDSRGFYPFADASAYVTGLARLGDVYLAAGNGDGGPSAALFAVTLDGEGVPGAAVTREIELPETAYPWVYAADADGEGFHILMGERPAVYHLHDGTEKQNPGYAGRFSLLTLSAGGEYVSETELGVWPGEAPAGVVAAGDGAFCVYGAEAFALYRGGEEVARRSAGESEITTLSRCGLGIIASWKDGSFALVDASDGALEPLDALAGALPSLCDCRDTDGAYITNDGENLRAVSEDGEAGPSLLRWSDYGREAGYWTRKLLRLGENAWLGLNQNARFLRLYHRAPDTAEREVVRVASVYSAFSSEIDAFNKSNSRYRLEVEEYETQAERDALMIEISAGDAPDLVLYSNFYIDTSSEYFVDLYPYIDADPELSRESFVPNLLEAIETEGELHELWAAFEIACLIRRGGAWPDEGLDSLADYIDLAAARGLRYAIDPPFNWEEMLSDLISLELERYIDREAAACCFDDGHFASLLRYCSTLPEGYDEEIVAETAATALLYYDWVQNTSRISRYDQLYGEGYEFVRLSDGRGGPTGSYFFCASGSAAAIPARAENKDGAWAFLRTLMLPDAQLRLQDDAWAPCLGTNLEALWLYLTQEQTDTVSGESFTLSDEVIDRLMGLIEQTTAIRGSDNDAVRELVYDSVQAYFAGDATLEDTVAQVQARVSLYMSERYG